jgi:ABC-type transporter Mla subunit MlaD
MRRIALTALLVAAAAGVALLGTGAGSSGGDYEVRAIFDNAVSVIPGEDVKIAGVKVGKVSGLDVTAQQKAAVVLRITEAGFQDFRSDATCTIRPQSLIGEKFVECTPTQPRPVGAPAAPPLRTIEDGPGKGQRLLPLANTSTPVDLDLVNDVLRRPYAERLAIIVGELGIGVAGRGPELRAAIRRSNPALEQTDRVLRVLAGQNRVLADLAQNSDRVLAPLARDRARVADSVVQTARVATATAERRADLERTIARLPRFLAELRPTMARLGALSNEAAPVFEDLGAQAPAVNSLVRQLGPFSEAATPALQTLGDATDVGRPVVVRARPVLRDLRSLARTARPLAANLGALTSSLRATGGIERALDYVFFQVAAINGFDSFGHYLRAALLVNLCSTYAVTPVGGCSANFIKGSGAAAAATASDPTLSRTSAVLRGADPRAVKRRARSAAAPGNLALPSISLPSTLPGGGTVAPRAPRRAPGTSRPLLDYLLGSER